MTYIYYIINIMRKHWPIMVILLVGLALHFIYFGHPREIVFDEVHFGKFISGYFTHQYFFDIHPPLGKLIISAAGYLTGFKPGFSFAEIGQKFPDNGYLWLRLLPTLAGALLPLVIYLLALELGFSRRASFAAGLFVALENAMLVQSRLILLDSFLLLFGFLSLMFYFWFKRKSNFIFLLLAGLSAALAISIKWTGATFLAIIGVLYLIDWFRNNDKIKGLIKGLVSLLAVPFVIYFLVFAAHFYLLTKTGPGDAFMTSEFRKTLEGSADSTNASLKPLNIFQKFKELNVQMYKSNAGLTATHPYSSKWYTWPFMIRPIYYWYQAGATPGTASRIYFLGNPVIWWVSAAAILYLILSTLDNLIRKIKPKFPEALIVGAYIFNLLPFVGIKRAMFLYHYMIGLIFAVLAMVYLIDKTENKKRIFTILLIMSIMAFIYFAPLTYGLPLSDKAYNLRVWLKTWL